jgi:uncharacterized membrane protein YqiK
MRPGHPIFPPSQSAAASEAQRVVEAELRSAQQELAAATRRAAAAERAAAQDADARTAADAAAANARAEASDLQQRLAEVTTVRRIAKGKQPWALNSLLYSHCAGAMVNPLPHASWSLHAPWFCLCQ